MLILPHPTLNDLYAPDFVRIAWRTGFDAVNLRIYPFRPDAVSANIFSDPDILRETARALRETGLVLHDIEVIRIEDGMRTADFAALFEVGAELGARYAVVVGMSDDEGFVAEHLAALAALAEPYGVRLVVEFMMRGGIRTLEQTQRVLDASGREDVGILIDALHFYRAGTTLDALQAIPPAQLPYMQINDVCNFEQLRDTRPAETVQWTKVLPGEGDLRLRELLSALPANIPISIETPGPPGMTTDESEAYARRARTALEGVLA